MVIIMSVENLPAQSAEASIAKPVAQPIESIAPTLQRGVSVTANVEAQNKATTEKAGLAPAEDFFGADWTNSNPSDTSRMQMAQAYNPHRMYEAQEPVGRQNYRDLPGDQQQMLQVLKQAGLQAIQNRGDTADLLRSLQTQADRFGRNADGSPKVSILAYQSKDTTRDTNFYATFNRSKEHQEQNRQSLEAARLYGTKYPSSSVGWIGSKPSRGPVG